MLKTEHSPGFWEAGCDEAGRGCLAGPVFAAAVILPHGYSHPLICDSKKLTQSQREKARYIIESDAVSWAVAKSDPCVIDEKNILVASILTMHQALSNLTLTPQLILVDGNRFIPYQAVPYHCIIRGDATYFSIAAASILAKTYRDNYMRTLDIAFPEYGWSSNKGYPTPKHMEAICKHGYTRHHRKSFSFKGQLMLDFRENT